MDAADSRLRTKPLQGSTMIVITHDAALAERAPRQVVIRDGLIEEDVSAAA